MDKHNIVTIGGLDCYEENGVAYLNLEQAARGLGFTHTEKKNGTEYTTVRWERIGGYLAEFGFAHKWAKDGFIPENIFYRLAMKAKNPAAEKFQAWVADEVIPSIRKTGGYIAGQETMTDDELVAAALIVANRKIQEREQRITSLEAVVDAQRQEIAAFEPVRGYVNQILSATGTMTTTQIAADYGLSARKLNEILHEEKIQHKVHKQWILYTEQMNKGYTQSVTIPITRKDGTPDTKMHTQWTQKGRLMIHGILTRRGFFANTDVQTGVI